MKFMLPFLLLKKRALAAIALLGVLASLINVYEPILAKQIFDQAFHIEALEEILQPAALWLALFLVKYVAQYAMLSLELAYRVAVFKKIRLYFFSTCLKKTLQFFQSNSSAYLAARCNNSIDDLDGMLLTKLLRCALASAELGLVLFFMLQISPLMTVCAVLLKGLEFYINFAFPLKALYKKQRDASAAVQKEMQNALNAVGLIKAGNKYREETKRYEKSLLSYLHHLYKRDAFDIVRLLLTRLSVEMSYPLIIVASAVFIYYGSISAGTVMAFLLYFQKMNPLATTVVYTLPIYKIAKGAAEELQQLAEAADEPLADGETLACIKSIRFENVSFAYASRQVLQNCSFTLQAGQVNALVGFSGAGKTTVVNLLLGFIRPTSGKIYINDKDICAYSLQSLRHCIALMSQNSIILERTLAENLLFHTEGSFDEKQFAAVLEQSCVNAIIEKQQDGLTSQLTANGSNLSGGEMQRICFARELMKQGELQIFDEPTASLDAVSEKVIMNTIRRLAQKKIVLLITHKLTNLKDDDNIYVLHSGRIAEQGTPSVLRAQNGIYSNLWQNQFK